jgi:hypothetical protein
MRGGLIHESFLLLFFKKEGLACLARDRFDRHPAGLV